MAKDIPSPVWGTIKQAAAIKQLNHQTIRKYITLGLIEAERVGPRLIRANLTSLDQIGRPLQYTGDAE